MKKILILLLVLVAGMYACNKHQTTPTQSSTISTLPNKATEYIDSNYPDASIYYVVVQKNSTAKFIVTLNTEEQLAFDQDGNYLGDGEAYNDGHHGGDTICNDTTHGHGHGHPGGGHHGGGHRGGPGHGISIDSLSQVIISYITTNFPGYNIRHAELDTLCPDGAVIEVMLGMRGAEPKKVIFDTQNNYLLWAKRIRYSDMPQPVKDYIISNFATYYVCDMGELFTMADNSLQYNVYLNKEQTHIYVRLKADGTLVCEQ
ncbi:MAG: PepSY-like domain-containing protein [Bacteroidales bacterium]|jgi:hypothetical protein